MIDMTEAWEQRVEASAIVRMGLERVNLPTPDYGAPSFEDLNTAVDFIRRHSQIKYACARARVCVRVQERERERQTDRQTDRQADRLTD